MRMTGKAPVPAGGPFLVLLPAGGPFIYFRRCSIKTPVPAGGLFVLYVFNVTADVSLQVRSQLSFCATADALDRGG